MMNRLTTAVRSAINGQNWYAALALALCLPDICGKLENLEGGSRSRYTSWFDANLAAVNQSTIHGKNVVFLTADDCYALRCALLHTGSDDVSEQWVRRVLTRFYFTTLNSHRILSEDTLALNVAKFCEEICDAVDVWMQANEDNPDVQKGLASLLEIRTEPFSPIPGVEIR